MNESLAALMWGYDVTTYVLACTNGVCRNIWDISSTTAPSYCPECGCSACVLSMIPEALIADIYDKRVSGQMDVVQSDPEEADDDAKKMDG